MCLVLKLDNGKVVSIADEQTDRRTKPPSTVLVHRLADESSEYHVKIYLVKKNILSTIATGTRR